MVWKLGKGSVLDDINEVRGVTRGLLLHQKVKPDLKSVALKRIKVNVIPPLASKGQAQPQ